MSLTSWKKVSPHSDFSIYNIPFGIYSDAEVKHRVCSAIGDEIIDLQELYQNGFFQKYTNRKYFCL